MDTQTGELTRIRFASETGFLIGTLSTEDGETTIKGTFPPGAMPRPGSRLRLSGTWKDDPKYGRQFEVAQGEELIPDTADGIAAYLAAYVDGLGPRRAAEIVARFGEDTWRVIDEEPERLADLPGITPEGARRIHDQVTAAAADREAYAELSGWDMTPKAIAKVCAAFGSALAAITELKANPYRLAEVVDGYGFQRADKVALRMGFQLDHRHRVTEGLVYALREAAFNDGHTVMDARELIEKARQPDILTGSVSEQVCDAALDELIHADRVQHEMQTGAYGLTDLVYAEVSLRSVVQDLLGQQHPTLAHNPTEDSPDWPLNDEQAAFIAGFADQGAGLLVLTGGAGVGKTFTLKALIAVATANRLRCALVAPTGKAAKRMTEQTGCAASTIHRYLGWNPEEGHFMRTRVDEEVLVVDEASMVDSRLMAELLRRVEPERTRVVLVGDVEQLPPVGPGQPFRDLIGCGRIPVYRLIRIMRTAADSVIPLNSQAILRGDMAGLELDDPQCRWLSVDDVAEIPGRIANLCRPEALRAAGLTPADVQVLTPMHKSPAGTRELNKRLAPVVNPDGEAIPGWPYVRTGDRVILGRNNYSSGYVNGDQGLVVGLAADGKSLAVDIGAGVVTVGKADSDDVQLAYAITIHKSQGSEYPAVIIPVTTSHWIMLARGLIYTALTRGKQRVLLIGQKKALAQAVKNVQAAARRTLLQEVL